MCVCINVCLYICHTLTSPKVTLNSPLSLPSFNDLVSPHPALLKSPPYGANTQPVPPQHPTYTTTTLPVPRLPLRPGPPRTKEVQCPALGREVFRAPAGGATSVRLSTLTSTLAAGDWRDGSAAAASGALWVYSCEL